MRCASFTQHYVRDQTWIEVGILETLQTLQMQAKSPPRAIGDSYCRDQLTIYSG